MSLMRYRINIVALELTICCRVVEDNGEGFFFFDQLFIERVDVWKKGQLSRYALSRGTVKYCNYLQEVILKVFWS